MKKACFISALSLVLSLCSFAQDTAKKPPTPALSPSKAVLESWNDVGRKLTAMAEDFPEAKYEFKPNPAQRSFAEQLLHAAAANYYFTNPVNGKPMPTTDNPDRNVYKTKADVVAYVKKSFADGAAAISARGDKGMSDLIVDWGNRKARISDFAYNVIEHDGEHYGQLVVYYRVAGMVPPESRPKK